MDSMGVWVNLAKTRPARAPSSSRIGRGSELTGRIVAVLQVRACQPASRLSLRICLSKTRAGMMRRSVATRPAAGPAV
jgi:hypothetical protein